MILLQLLTTGFVPNLHLYIGNGSFYCMVCKAYARHEAYSRGSDHRLVCTVCKTVHGYEVE